LDGIWDDEDFKDIKQQCQPVIEKLERELAKLSQADTTINEELEFCAEFFSNLTNYYESGDLMLKRQIIGLIYPEKFVFKENTIQPTRVHSAIPLICRTGAGFKGGKNKNAPEISGAFQCGEPDWNLFKPAEGGFEELIWDKVIDFEALGD
jgi:site-specific DNA recombinase